MTASFLVKTNSPRHGPVSKNGTTPSASRKATCPGIGRRNLYIVRKIVSEKPIIVPFVRFERFLDWYRRVFDDPEASDRATMPPELLAGG
jgi:hypothetical protein